MKLQLSNGYEINTLGVHGGSMEYQGVRRDVLTYLFDESQDLTELNQLFSVENCKSVKIINDDDSFDIHENYTIRVGLGVAFQDVATSRYSVQYHNNYQDSTNKMVAYVAMAQSTPQERQLNQQQEVIDTLLLSSL